jgi:surface polysaccharide O-acyltransferase-like enzyme
MGAPRRPAAPMIMLRHLLILPGQPGHTDIRTAREADILIEERNYGIDLLKIISMFMVSLMHVLCQGGLFAQYERGSGNFAVAQVLLGLSFCAVNCFAMTTGYLCTDHRFRYARILPLWLTTVFYGVVITGLFAIIDPSVVDSAMWQKSLLPVCSRTYWYFTAYFLLFFLMPMINKAYDGMTREESIRLLVILFVLLSVITTFLRSSETMSDPFVMGDGANPFWLVYMYLIGSHIKRHVSVKKHTRLKALLLYLACTAVIALTGVFMEQSPLYVYTSPTVVIQAACLVVFLADSGFDPGPNAGSVLRLMSSLSFSVYLFQLHPIVWNEILKDKFVPYAGNPPAMTVVFSLGIALLLYLGASAADLIRFALFRMLRITELSNAVFLALGIDKKKRKEPRPL